MFPNIKWATAIILSFSTDSSKAFTRKGISLNKWTVSSFITAPEQFQWIKQWINLIGWVSQRQYMLVACFQQIEFFMQDFFFGFNSLGKRNGEEHTSSGKWAFFLVMWKQFLQHLQCNVIHLNHSALLSFFVLFCTLVVKCTWCANLRVAPNYQTLHFLEIILRKCFLWQ